MAEGFRPGKKARDAGVANAWAILTLPDDLDWGKVATQLNQQRDAMLGESVAIHGTVAWVKAVTRLVNESDDIIRRGPSSNCPNSGRA